MPRYASTSKENINNAHGHPLSAIGALLTRVSTVTTVETTTDNMVIFDSATAKSFYLLPATGSNRIRQIANVNVGVVTVDADGTDTIDAVGTQAVNGGDCLWIIDYATGKWKIM